VARLLVEGDDLRVLLGWLERFGAFAGYGFSVPLEAVGAVRVSDDQWHELRGMRAPGTGLPGVIALGTWRHSLGRDFVAVYGRRSAVVVDLSAQRFSRLVISRADADRVADEIRGASL
jgi:hypothetical protein